MKLDLLEKVFTDTDTSFYLEEAKEISKLFFHSAMNLEAREINDFLDDYWIQLGHDWDLNIYFNDVEGQYKAVLYEVADGIVDDTQNPISIDI